MTASYPETSSTWRALGKQHHLSGNKQAMTVYALALHDPHDVWQTSAPKCNTGEVAHHPSASVTVPAGYVMVGGGAKVNWSGDGSLLTASFPANNRTWSAKAKDHLSTDKSSITVCVIGLKSNIGARLTTRIEKSTSAKLEHPTARSSPNTGQVLVGGGAHVNWTGEGNLLTGSYPADQITWQVNSKDHVEHSPSTITAYSIGLKVH